MTENRDWSSRQLTVRAKRNDLKQMNGHARIINKTSVSTEIFTIAPGPIDHVTFKTIDGSWRSK